MSNKLDRSGKLVGRPTLLLQQERDEEIVQLLLEFKPRKEIYKFFKDKYNIQPKSVDGLLTKGYKLIAERYSVDKEATVNLHIAKYYQIMEDASQVDFKAQISALQSIEKLLRLTAPETLVQNNSLNVNLKDLTINELKELLSGNLNKE